MACLFSVHNTKSLSRHEQVCLMRLRLKRYFDRLQNSIKHLKGTILEKDFVEKVHENLYNKSFHLTINRHMQKYVKDENNNAKNSTTFSDYIRNVPTEDEKIMVSFDVTSLYTNVPILDTLNIIKDYVNNDD